MDENRNKDKENESGHGHGGHDETISGTLSVSGEGSVTIPCRGRPFEVEVSFIDDPTKMGCGPQEDDEVEIEIISIKKPFPLWALKITWDVKGANTREIEWRTTVR